MQEQAKNLDTNDVSLLNRFKAKANEFMNALDRLNNIGEVPPNLAEEFSYLTTTAEVVSGTIQTITGTVDSVTGFFSDFFAFDGVAATRDYINNKPAQGMGLIPLIPVAMIAGAIAAMSKFIADVYVFERKITEQKRLEATGMKPEQAAQIVDKISGQGVIQQLQGLAKPVGFALSLFFISRIIKAYVK